MKILKQLLLLITVGLLICSCGSSPLKKNQPKEQPVVIANDSLEYEIVIIDVGFNFYLNSIAKPMSFHSQSYLEGKNAIFISTWNRRARNLSQFSPDIYGNVIDYDLSVNYGLEVNYKLYWYFKFAEKKHKMRLR